MNTQKTKPNRTSSLLGLAKSTFNHVAKVGISSTVGAAAGMLASAFVIPREGIEILNLAVQNVPASVITGIATAIGTSIYLYKSSGQSANDNTHSAHAHLPNLTESIARSDKVVGGLSATCNGVAAFALSGAVAAMVTGNEYAGLVGVPIGLYTAVRNYQRSTIGGPALRAAQAQNVSPTPTEPS